MAEFFTNRITHIYFIYGLGFFSLGLAVALEAGRSSGSRLARAMWPLAVFGLAHGFHEWVEMFEQFGVLAYGFNSPAWLEWTRVGLLAFSFASLIAFGVRALTNSRRHPMRDVWVALGALVFYGIGVLFLGAWVGGAAPAWHHVSDVWARYALGMPGALLAGMAFWTQGRQLRSTENASFANDFVWAAITFFLYGLVGQIFVRPSLLFPSTFVNQDLFQSWFGFPVQAFRATLAVFMAIFVIRALRLFEAERQQQLATAEAQARDAIARRDALRGELLRMTVAAQEEERARLARELHDDTLQVLTALAAGLKGTEQILTSNPEQAAAQLTRLSAMSSHAIDELRRLIVDLRPSVLDDMGLAPALHWYADRLDDVMPTQVVVMEEDPGCRFSAPVETILFRIAQEGLANVARHAQADHAAVRLSCDLEHVYLTIEDDGVGFDPHDLILADDASHGWGLIGIEERVSLIGGDFQVESTEGKGTRLHVTLPVDPALSLTLEDDHE